MAKPRSSAKSAARDTSIATYRARRDFAETPEPAPVAYRKRGKAPIFVVQKHDATRLHYDFRLEHGGVLWSWAVPKGPSLDPADKRLAVRTEDHPLDYADFAGVIPEGNYGAGTVEIWDNGTWEPQALPDPDPARALEKGELKFVLHGKRLNGGFVLVRLKPRPKDRSENWLLIKEHDAAERKGGDADAVGEATASPAPKRARGVWTKKGRQSPPAPGAVEATMPKSLEPQLASSAAAAPPDGARWISEFKFDGYRLLAFKQGDAVRLVTRNGHDWTTRMPRLARAFAQIKADAAIIDGELVVPREDGVTSFALLQQALSEGNDKDLRFYAFDLPFVNGWDLRGCRLLDRKAALRGLADWRGTLHYSDHVEGRLAETHDQACRMGLEGVICKRADAPYRSGRGKTWLKLKCHGREEFIVLGFTPPAGSRTGLGALHLGYRDPKGALQYVGGAGTGFTAKELAALRGQLDALKAEPPDGLVYADEKPDRQITWVKPELVAEVRFAGWSGSGRIRQATYLGLREDKPADAVVRAIADPQAKRVPFVAPAASRIVHAAPPARRPAAAAMRAARARRSDAGREAVAGVVLTHANRELWPGVSKRDLAEYWIAVANHALPEIAGRPLALVRCPEGIDGERFFQKHARPGFPKEIRAGEADGAPYLVLDDVAGLAACAQVAAIEVHAWGSTEADALHPDRVVFDLDPGEGVAFADVVRAAVEVRARLEKAGFAAFCRTTGGKGLHVLAPVQPAAGWDATRAWCRGFAEAMAEDSPDRYVSRLPKMEREGKILVDWLRNGLGSTAVASFSPRARPGAMVATRLAWREVTAKLDPAAFTIATVPARLKRQRSDPWADFGKSARPIPAGKGG